MEATDRRKQATRILEELLGNSHSVLPATIIDLVIETAKDEIRQEIKQIAQKSALEAAQVLRYHLEKGTGLI